MFFGSYKKDATHCSNISPLKGVGKGRGAWGLKTPPPNVSAKKTNEGRSILLTKRDTPFRLTPH